MRWDLRTQTVSTSSPANEIGAQKHCDKMKATQKTPIAPRIALKYSLMNGPLYSVSRKTSNAFRLACACLALGIATGCTTHVEMQQRDTALETNERGITEFTLPNGMKVLVKENHRAPVAIVQVWYRVGSNDEPDGLTGISHALEHMMFKGNSRIPRRKIHADHQA